MKARPCTQPAHKSQSLSLQLTEQPMVGILLALIGESVSTVPQTLTRMERQSSPSKITARIQAIHLPALEEQVQMD